jgi:hypothetical protein
VKLGEWTELIYADCRGVLFDGGFDYLTVGSKKEIGHEATGYDDHAWRR